MRCYHCRVGVLLLKQQRSGFRVKCSNEKCHCGVLFKEAIRNVKLSGKGCDRCSGGTCVAVLRVEMLGTPVPTLQVTTDATSFELCVCGHDISLVQYGVQFLRPMDMAVVPFSASELSQPYVGVKEKKHALESEVKRDLTGRGRWCGE